MTSDFALAFLLVLVIVNLRIGRGRVLYPPFIFSLIWLIDVFVYRMSFIELDRVHLITWLLVCAGASIFSLAGWLTMVLPSRIFKVQIAEFSRPAVSAHGRSLLIALCAIGLPIYFMHVWSGSLAAGGGFLSGARQLTLATVAANRSTLTRNPITSYLPVFSIWTSIICVIEAKDKRFWIAFVTSLTICILATGRTLPLLLFSSVLAAYLIRQRKDTIRQAWRIVAIPVIVFSVLVLLLIVFEKNSSAFNGNTTAFLLNYTVAYLVSPLPALDYVLRHPVQYLHTPNHTFGFLIKALNVMGYSFSMPNNTAISGYVFVPLPTNVYTFYKPYLLDFGLCGLCATIFLIGFIQAFLYRRAIEGDRVCLFMTALFVFPAILSVFDDSYAQFVLEAMAFGLAVSYFGLLRRLRPAIRFRSLYSSRAEFREERPSL